MRTMATYQHTHMCQQLLQGILLKRSWPHGTGAMMQVLIDCRNAGAFILCPEATSGSCQVV
jgi:hypothetical protein